jgi:hypothetical protein
MLATGRLRRGICRGIRAAVPRCDGGILCDRPCCPCR